MYLPRASLPQFSLTLPSKPLTSLSSDCKASHPGFSRILPKSSVCRAGERRGEGERREGLEEDKGKISGETSRKKVLWKWGK